MKRTHSFSLVALLAGSILTGCASDPGQFAGGNYQQIAIAPQSEVTTVTVLRLAPKAQKEMMLKQGTQVIGKSVFTIDSDNLKDTDLESQAKAQAEAVKANVVLLSQAYTGEETKTKIVEQKSEFQQAVEDIPLVGAVDDEDKHSNSSSTTTYNDDGSSETKSSGTSTSFSMVGAASLADLTALIPGNVVHKKVDYKVKDYEIHAIYLRSPIYPGLK